MLVKWEKFVHQSYLVVGLCVGIIFGIITGLVLRINYFSSWWWLVLVAVLLTAAYLRPRLVFVVVAVLAGMVLAWFRVAEELYGEDYIRQFQNQAVVLTGVVDGDPNTDEKGMKFKLKNLRFGENKVQAKESVYLTVKEENDIRRADEVTVEGQMMNGFGAYAGYMYQPFVRNVRRPEPGDLVLRVRDWFAERVRRLLPEREAALGMSYLLGMKTGLDDELSEKLRVVGLVHIIVASGAHLAILVEVARKIFGRLSRFAGVLFAGLFTVLFMAMVGWTPSIMRAGMMTILSLITWYYGRRMAAWRLILLVAAGTLMLEPNFVMNLGWLLSFASFAGIMMLGPGMAKFFYGARKPGFVASMIMTTVAATLMTLPITLYYYGTMSLISVVANLLILPTLPWAMGMVFLTGVVAGVPGAETVAAWCTERMLDYHIAVVSWFGEKRQFLVEVEPYQGWVFALYLVVVGPGLILLLRRIMVKLKKVDNNNFDGS